MANWPKDNQAALIKFYGDPASGEIAEHLVPVSPPFQLYYGQKAMKPNRLLVHDKCAEAFKSAFQKIWDYYGHDQKLIDKLHISWSSGTYNPRRVRGSATKWSNHAFGAAWDVDAEHNPLGTVANRLPLPVVAAFKSEGAAWGGDYKSRKDNMHLEFCDRGDPKRSFEQWLAFYDQPALLRPLPNIPTPPAPPPVVPKPEVVVVPIDKLDGVTGDPKVWNTQRRLKDMGYNPGGTDGVWGGLTAGAISGFLNDRQSKIVAPTSLEDFLTQADGLSVEFAKAESERFKRPIAPERSEAKPSDLAPKIPEVDASIKAERLGFWGSIAAGLSALITTISKTLGDAVEMLNPLKQFVADVPWQVWIVGALILSAALYYISRKSGEAKNAATQAYKEGSRS